MKSKNEKGELLNAGYELQKEYKNEIEKIKLCMLQIVAECGEGYKSGYGRNERKN